MVAVEELDEIFIVTNDKFHTHFEEWAKEATYDIELTVINDYQKEGYNMDANGNFIPYLLEHSSVYGFVFDEYCYDIGTLESYEQVQKLFANEKLK